ncbi:hypothetical protein [Limisalsivibrio acetivorans]|uniref:hypothetical protein n=1 Tax=Limisalsivibrio acetivorans TaxID=1304888 RepID=UPI0003B570D5|nr:hypothetical protein [Limisalsivibrio acetivorans]
MRKLLVVLMVLAFASTALAVDVKLNGFFKVKGGYFQNKYFASDDTQTEQWWEQDGEVFAKFEVEKGTAVFVRTEFHDETWKSPDGGADEDITVERAWMMHDFGSVAVHAGLMSGGGWSHSFGNDVGGKYRVKLTSKLPMGSLVAFIQKNAENGYGLAPTDDEDSEKDDSDTYAVGMKMKMGALSVEPLLVYTNNSAAVMDGDDDGMKKTSLDVGLAGDFGALGFEAELDYDSVTTDVAGAEDYNLYGLYANVFMNMGNLTPGFIFAYGSTDEDANVGYDFDDDFDSAIILGDELGVGGGDDLTGMTLYALYLNAKLSKKAKASVQYAYATSNWDSDTTASGFANPEDGAAQELDVVLSYKITDAVGYKVQFAYASVNDDVKDDADPAYYASHELKVSF